MARIAFLGTGLLGSGMVRRLLKNGSAVTVWNRTAAKAQALAADGAAVAASPQAAVEGADRIHLVLSSDGAVDEVLGMIGPVLPSGAIVIDHSTTLPEKTAARFARVRERGLRFVHAPVFMSPAVAAEGGGLMLASGAAADVAAVQPDLEAMSGSLWVLGERPDLAAAYKLFGNAMLFAIVAGLGDVMAMSRANGIDPMDALSVFSRFQATNVIHVRGPRMATGEMTPASFTMEMARKDAGLMLEAARGEPLVALPAIAKRMDEVIAAGHGDDDLAALGAPRRVR